MTYIIAVDDNFRYFSVQIFLKTMKSCVRYIDLKFYKKCRRLGESYIQYICYFLLDENIIVFEKKVKTSSFHCCYLFLKTYFFPVRVATIGLPVYDRYYFYRVIRTTISITKRSLNFKASLYVIKSHV